MVGVAIPILLTVVPPVLSAVKVVSGIATQESLVRDIKVTRYLKPLVGVTGTIGPLILVASWLLMKQKRKEKELR